MIIPGCINFPTNIYFLLKKMYMYANRGMDKENADLIPETSGKLKLTVHENGLFF